MTEQEMMARIEELEQENAKLKGHKTVFSIVGSIKNQAEMDFVYPYYDMKDNKWRRNKNDTFLNLRKVAMSTVNTVNQLNRFKEQKVKELSDKDKEIVVNCADELIAVAAKYKKQYLQSVGRDDIVEAFKM